MCASGPVLRRLHFGLRTSSIALSDSRTSDSARRSLLTPFPDLEPDISPPDSALEDSRSRTAPPHGEFTGIKS